MPRKNFTRTSNSGRSGPRRSDTNFTYGTGHDTNLLSQFERGLPFSDKKQPSVVDNRLRPPKPNDPMR